MKLLAVFQIDVLFLTCLFVFTVDNDLDEGIKGFFLSLEENEKVLLYSHVNGSNRYVSGRKALEFCCFCWQNVKSLCSVHTMPEDVKNAVLFLRLGLPSKLIRHAKKMELFENVLQTGRIWKRGFACGQKTFWKRRFFENDDSTLFMIFLCPRFSSNTNPKWPVIVASSNLPGVVWTGP